MMATVATPPVVQFPAIHPDPSGVRAEIDAFNAAYGLCIDDDRLESWPDFFLPDARYRIIGRENVDLGLPAAIYYCDGRGMMVDRIVALRKANIYPAHTSRHVIGMASIIRMDGDGDHDGQTVAAQASYALFQTRADGESRIFSVGKYVDRFERVSGRLLLAERSCVYDTHRVSTLLVTPV